MPKGEENPVVEQPRRSPAVVDLRGLVADEDHRIALFGPLLLSVWIKETTIEAIHAMGRHIETFAGAAPGGRLGLFVVVEPNATIPSAAARAELSRMRRAAAIAMTALVYEGTGFGAALVRGVTTGLNVLEPSKTRTHIFADVKSAAEWIRRTSPEYGGGLPLEAAVVALRGALPMAVERRGEAP